MSSPTAMTIFPGNGEGFSIAGPFATTEPGVEPQRDGFYHTSQTTTATAELHNVAGLDVVFQPEVIIPSIVLGAAALGAAVGYRFQKWRHKQTAALEKNLTEEAAEDEPMERSLSHQGTGLVLRNLLADVTITEGPEGSQDLSMTVQGKKRRVNSVVLKTVDDQLVAEGPTARYMRGSMLRLEVKSATLHRFVKRMIKTSGLEFVDESDVMQVTAVVPRGSDLAINYCDGKVAAKGAFGDIEADGNSGTMQLENVHSVYLTAGSYNKVRIGAMEGELQLDAGYSSNINIRGGSITNAEAVLQSYAKVNIDADIMNASVDVGYSSKANLAMASGEVNLKTASYADVDVAGGKATSLTIDGGYTSHNKYRGAAQEAKVTLGSYADATLGSAANLELDGGYTSKTYVQQGDIADAGVVLASYALLRARGGGILDGNLDVGYSATVDAMHYGRNVQIAKSSYAKIVRH